MELLLPLIAFVTMLWIARAIEQRKDRKVIVKAEMEPAVETKVEPHRINIEPKVRPSSLKMEDRGLPSSDEPTDMKKKRAYSGAGVKVTRDSVLNGIIMAEILSPPKCRRK